MNFRKKNNKVSTVGDLNKKITKSYLETLQEDIKKEVLAEFGKELILDKEVESYSDFDLFRMLCTIMNTSISRWEGVKKLYEKKIEQYYMKDELKTEVKTLNNLILMIKNLNNMS